MAHTLIVLRLVMPNHEPYNSLKMAHPTPYKDSKSQAEHEAADLRLTNYNKLLKSKIKLCYIYTPYHQ